MKPKHLHVNLCRRLPPETLEALRRSLREPVVLEVPETWCYCIHRPPPPGGWSRALRARLRPGLFPEPCADLYLDEEITAEGTWVVWALPQARLQRALGDAESLLWKPGRKVRILPEGSGNASRLADFPNLAPPAHRPLRLPWPAIRRWTWRVLPGALVLLLAISGYGWLHVKQQAAWKSRLAAEQSVTGLQSQLDQERRLLAALERTDSGKHQEAPWVADLDALTRLLPEDTRLVGLKWRSEGLQIELITPHPELVREILDASSEFQGTKFLGNLERHDGLARLNIELKPKGAR